MTVDPQRLERLWAPWRYTYVSGGSRGATPSTTGIRQESIGDRTEPTCFICQSLRATTDRENLVVYRGVHLATLLNRYPYSNGHLLVVPCRHLDRLEALGTAEQVELWGTLTRMIGVLESLIQPTGFNVGLNLGRAAGAGVPGHLHWHIVPRWTGDTNFLTTVANSRVISQSLDMLWELMTEALPTST